MFNFSSKTVTNKVWKLTDFLKFIKADKTMKTSAINISTVTLTNVLNEKNTGLPTCENIKEIYFMELTLTDRVVPLEFIKHLDKKILFQTVYTLIYENNVKIMLTYKTIDTDKATFTKHYETKWLTNIAPTTPLNSSLSDTLKDITAIVTEIPFRAEESFRTYIDRLSEIEKNKKMIIKSEKEINKAKNPKEKLIHHEKMKQLKIFDAELRS